MGKGGNLTIEDRFQYAAFRTHYKINRRAGDSNAEAFGKAIAATSDEATERAIERTPDAIRQWGLMRPSLRKRFL